MDRYKEEKILNAIYETRNQIYKKIEENQIDRFYVSDLYDLRLGEIVESVIKGSLINLLNSGKFQNKLAEIATNQLLAKDRNNRKERKKFERKQRALWKITKGVIPCLNQCGYTRQYTKDEIMHESCNYICKKCCDKGGNSFDIFDRTNIYKIFNIV